MKLKAGQVAAITGAGSGIGRSLAIFLAGKGLKLALADINAQGLQETEALCRGSAEVITTRLDVSNRQAVESWAAEVQAAFGGVNLLINNAGVALAATVEEASIENMEWLMGINFWGVVYGTKAFLPLLKAADEAHLVNVSSVFGIIAFPGNSAYNASKFAVRGFTECLRQELEIEGARVSVTCVHPGGIDTNIAASARVVENAGFGIKDAAAGAKDFKKVARTTPDEAARTILKAVEGNARRSLVGVDARFIDLLQRFAPTGYQKLVSAVAKRMGSTV